MALGEAGGQAAVRGPASPPRGPPMTPLQGLGSGPVSAQPEASAPKPTLAWLSRQGLAVSPGDTINGVTTSPSSGKTDTVLLSPRPSPLECELQEGTDWHSQCCRNEREEGTSRVCPPASLHRALWHRIRSSCTTCCPSLCDHMRLSPPL